MTEPTTVPVERLQWTREAVIGRAGATGLISANMPGWSVFQMDTYGVRATREDGSVVFRVLPRGLASRFPELDSSESFAEGLRERMAAQPAGSVIVEDERDNPVAP